VSWPPSVHYKRYVLATLTVVYTLNFLDRAVLILLLEPIKKDLLLSDTQLGFITGIAFALFYGTLGIPLARWADRGDRVTLTAAAIALWGITVMSCLWVRTFAQLVVARIAAAVGEAGCMPPTYSLLGDYFPAARERTRAMAIYWLANPLSALVSFIVGGWLNEHYGWRVTFFVLGLPALVVALVVKLSIKEPRGRASKPREASARPAYREVLLVLWRQRSARHLGAAIILLFMMGIGLGQWFAAFMIRTHHMSTGELGTWLGLILGLGGIVGIVLGGYGPRHGRLADERSQMRLCAIMIAALVPCSVAFLLLPRRELALLALVPWAVVLNYFFGPAFALMQRLVREDMRATTLAIVMLLANLIGMGAGPQLVGILSDALAPTFGADSLRYAMLAISLVAFWSAAHFWQVGKHVAADLDQAHDLPLPGASRANVPLREI
jgi:MFS family permease